MMDIILANPRGFCAGVDRAIEIVAREGAPSPPPPPPPKATGPTGGGTP